MKTQFTLISSAVLLTALLPGRTAAQHDSGIENMEPAQVLTNMSALNHLLPLTTTDNSGRTQYLARAASLFSPSETRPHRDKLPHPPANLQDAAEMLRALRESFFHATDYRDYFVFSNSERPPYDPFTAEGMHFISTTNAVPVIIKRLNEDPNVFMSGIIVRKNDGEYAHYDCTRTYTLTPTGVKIRDHRSVLTNNWIAPNNASKGIRQPADGLPKPSM